MLQPQSPSAPRPSWPPDRRQSILTNGVSLAPLTSAFKAAYWRHPACLRECTGVDSTIPVTPIPATEAAAAHRIERGLWNLLGLSQRGAIARRPRAVQHIRNHRVLTDHDA